jgi:hypothetical protein
MLVDQFIQQSIDRVHNVAIYVAALTSAFYECGRHAGILGQQRGVTIGFAVDELLERGLKFIFSRLEREY